MELDYRDQLKSDCRAMHRYRQICPREELDDVTNALIEIQEELYNLTGRYYNPSKLESHIDIHKSRKL